MKITEEYFNNLRENINKKSYNTIAAGDALVGFNVNELTDDETSSHEILKTLLKDGYGVFDFSQAIDNSLEAVQKLLLKNFGLLRGNLKHNFTTIQSEKNAKFYVNSNWTQPMHTDEGHTQAFPRIVAMYCCQSADDGGETILVKFAPLYSELQTKFGTRLNQLFSPDCLKVTNVYGVQTKPLLLWLESGCVGISYSPILTELICAEDVFEIFDHITKYVHNPANQIRFKLQKNQLLVLNNQRIFHARTSFPVDSSRILYRFWF